NTAPLLAGIPDQIVAEGTLLSLTASATDVDIPVNLLTFSLGSGAPSGMTIDSTTGALTWTPSEGQGPGIYAISVIVLDNGTPALSSTNSFTVVVTEANSAPVLAP